MRAYRRPGKTTRHGGTVSKGRQTERMLRFLVLRPLQASQPSNIPLTDPLAFRLDYIDLYLIHAPYGGTEGRLGAWKALVEAVEAKKVRSIGVSNYGVQHLDELEQWQKVASTKWFPQSIC